MIPTPTPGRPPAAAHQPVVLEYRLRPEDTAVTFTTKHLAGLGTVTGSVRLRAGRMLLDADAERLVLLEAELDLRSFDSGSRARDRAVLSPRFLDVRAHPTATYRSESAERVEAGWVVHGVLTVNGIGSPLQLRVADLDVATAVEAHVTASVDRFDLGITVPTFLASRRLEVVIEARADRIDG